MDSLLNDEYIKAFITHNQTKHIDKDGKEYFEHTSLPFLWTHGATSSHLGDGLLIYSLIQHMRAKVCVCLGSGGGFIPRIMTQARYDLHRQGIFEGNNEYNWGDIGATYLVDAANGVGGTPDYLEEDSFFRRNFFPRLIVDTTENAYYDFFVKEDIKIDFLFIDADHSYKGVKKDFKLYSKLVKKTGIIALHDTDRNFHSNLIVTEDAKKDFYTFDGPSKFIEEIGDEFKVFNLFNEGILRDKPSSTGLTLVQHA